MENRLQEALKPNAKNSASAENSRGERNAKHSSRRPFRPSHVVCGPWATHHHPNPRHRPTDRSAVPGSDHPLRVHLRGIVVDPAGRRSRHPDRHTRPELRTQLPTTVLVLGVGDPALGRVDRWAGRLRPALVLQSQAGRRREHRHRTDNGDGVAGNGAGRVHTLPGGCSTGARPRRSRSRPGSPRCPWRALELRWRPPQRRRYHLVRDVRRPPSVTTNRLSIPTFS